MRSELLTISVILIIEEINNAAIREYTENLDLSMDWNQKSITLNDWKSKEKEKISIPILMIFISNSKNREKIKTPRMTTVAENTLRINNVPKISSLFSLFITSSWTAMPFNPRYVSGTKIAIMASA